MTLNSRQLYEEALALYHKIREEHPEDGYVNNCIQAMAIVFSKELEHLEKATNRYAVVGSFGQSAL